MVDFRGKAHVWLAAVCIIAVALVDNFGSATNDAQRKYERFVTYTHAERQLLQAKQEVLDSGNQEGSTSSAVVAHSGSQKTSPKLCEGRSLLSQLAQGIQSAVTDLSNAVAAGPDASDQIGGLADAIPEDMGGKIADNSQPISKSASSSRRLQVSQATPKSGGAIKRKAESPEVQLLEVYPASSKTSTAREPLHFSAGPQLPCFAAWSSSLSNYTSGNWTGQATAALVSPKVLEFSFNFSASLKVLKATLVIASKSGSKPLSLAFASGQRSTAVQKATLPAVDAKTFQAVVANLSGTEVDVVVKANTSTQTLKGVFTANCSASQAVGTAARSPAAAPPSKARKLCSQTGFTETFVIPAGLNVTQSLLSNCSVAAESVAVATVLSSRSSFQGWASGSTVCIPKGCGAKLTSGGARRSGVKSRALFESESGPVAAAKGPGQHSGHLFSHHRGARPEASPPGKARTGSRGPSAMHSVSATHVSGIFAHDTSSGEKQSATKTMPPAKLQRKLIAIPEGVDDEEAPSISDLVKPMMVEDVVTTLVTDGPAPEIIAVIEESALGFGTAEVPAAVKGASPKRESLVSEEDSMTVYTSDTISEDSLLTQILVVEDTVPSPSPADPMIIAGTVETLVEVHRGSSANSSKSSAIQCSLASGFPVAFTVPANCSEEIAGALFTSCNVSARAVAAASSSQQFKGLGAGSTICLPAGCNPCLAAVNASQPRSQRFLSESVPAEGPLPDGVTVLRRASRTRPADSEGNVKS